MMEEGVSGWGYTCNFFLESLMCVCVKSHYNVPETSPVPIPQANGGLKTGRKVILDPAMPVAVYALAHS